MSVMPSHRYAMVFDDADAFVSDRWLDRSVKSDHSSLAYADFYPKLSSVLRHIDLRFLETTSGDIEAMCNAFMPMLKEGFKRVGVLAPPARAQELPWSWRNCVRKGYAKLPASFAGIK